MLVKLVMMMCCYSIYDRTQGVIMENWQPVSKLLGQLALVLAFNVKIKPAVYSARRILFLPGTIYLTDHDLVKYGESCDGYVLGDVLVRGAFELSPQSHNEGTSRLSNLPGTTC
jgi:hypothetical protein